MHVIVIINGCFNIQSPAKYSKWTFSFQMYLFILIKNKLKYWGKKYVLYYFHYLNIPKREVFNHFFVNASDVDI